MKLYTAHIQHDIQLTGYQLLLRAQKSWPDNWQRSICEIMMEQFVYWYFLYTVTTAAPPSPRLCCRAREAPDTWRFPASPRSWRRKYHTIIITYMVPAIAHGWRSKGHTTSDHNLPASWAQNTELVLLLPGDAPLKSDLHCNATKRDCQFSSG